MSIEFVTMCNINPDTKKRQKKVYNLGLLVKNEVLGIGVLLEVNPKSDGIYLSKTILKTNSHTVLAENVNCLSSGKSLQLQFISDMESWEESLELVKRDLRIFLYYGVIPGGTDELVSSVLDDENQRYFTKQDAAYEKTNSRDAIDEYLRFLAFICMSHVHPIHPVDLDYLIYIDLGRPARLRYIIFHMDGDKIESFTTKELAVSNKSEIKRMNTPKLGECVMTISTTITISGKTYKEKVVTPRL